MASLAHPDDAARLEVEHTGHVLLPLVHRDLVDRQQPQPIVIRRTDLPLQPALVDLLHRVPRKPEMLRHVLNRQHPAKVRDRSLEAHGRTRKGERKSCTSARIPQREQRAVRCGMSSSTSHARDSGPAPYAAGNGERPARTAGNPNTAEARMGRSQTRSGSARPSRYPPATPGEAESLPQTDSTALY